VAEAQQLLLRLGFNVGSSDGVDGSRTRSAVRAYQANRGLNPDGVVSESLLVALRKDLNNRWAGSTAAAVTTAAAAKEKEKDSGWLASATRKLHHLFGRDFDSVRRPAEIGRYCAGDPDTWVFDEAIGKLVLCGQVAGAAPQLAAESAKRP
jgi:hypothetical protein